jgi:hypothetical protein
MADGNLARRSSARLVSFVRLGLGLANETSRRILSDRALSPFCESFIWRVSCLFEAGMGCVASARVFSINNTGER